MIESTLLAMMKAITGVSKVFFDGTPDGYIWPASGATIIIQQVGGEVSSYIGKENMPDHKHGRFQIEAWERSRVIAGPLGRLIENTLMLSALNVEAYGAQTAIAEPLYKLFGTRQQFGIWYPDP